MPQDLWHSHLILFNTGTHSVPHVNGLTLRLHKVVCLDSLAKIDTHPAEVAVLFVYDILRRAH